MTAQARCIGCGAAIAADAPSCPYCGAAGATEASVAAPVVADTKADRLRRLRESPSFERLRSFRPSSAGPTAGLLFRCVFGLVFAAFAVGFIVVTRSMSSGMGGGRGMGGLDIVFTLVPGVLVVIGVGAFVSAIVKWRRFSQAPLVAVPAIVSGKRTKVVGVKDSTRTEYFVTIEAETGPRREYQAADEVFGVVGDGDVGVAYVRDAYLLGFRTVDA